LNRGRPRLRSPNRLVTGPGAAVLYREFRLAAAFRRLEEVAGRDIAFAAARAFLPRFVDMIAAEEFGVG